MTTRIRTRSETTQRGAALVEFALVALLLATLVFATFEIGMAWRDSQRVAQAARGGARAASQLGVDTSADEFAVETVRAGIGHLADSTRMVIIYKADTANGEVPAACLAGSPPGIPGVCSIYDQGSYTSFNQGSWKPKFRNNSPINADYVGVYVEVERNMLTGFLGDSPFKISDRAVMRIEPEAGD